MPTPICSGTTARSRGVGRLTGPAVAVVLVLLLVWSVPVTPVGAVADGPAATSSAPAPGSAAVAVEPADRYRSVDALITGARRSVDLAVYELSDPVVEALLIDAQHRGVAVRVLLDRAWHGGSVNRAAASRLVSAGVAVRWAASSVLLHEKVLTVDGEVAAVLTGNLVADPGDTRDFVVLDRDPTAVAAIGSVFGDDWRRLPARSGPGGAGLVWSPGAEPALVGLIDGARVTLSVENEEMASPAIVAALESAARRGVRVEVTMTADPAWDPALAALTRSGVRVATYPDTGSALYVHAKAMVADGAVAFLGSQNFSTGSLDDNRELGVITTDPAVVDTTGQVLASDFAGATPFPG